MTDAATTETLPRMVTSPFEPIETVEEARSWVFRGGCGLSAVLLVLMVLLAALSTLSTSGPHDSPRSEGEQLLGAARDFLRVEYSKTAKLSAALPAFRTAVSDGQFAGRYYHVSADVRQTTEGVAIKTAPGTAYRSGFGTGHMTFNLASGNSTIRWE